MRKTLALMRHGKAQSRNAGVPDEERKFTQAGKRALEALLDDSDGIETPHKPRAHPRTARPIQVSAAVPLPPRRFVPHCRPAPHAPIQAMPATLAHASSKERLSF